MNNLVQCEKCGEWHLESARHGKWIARAYGDPNWFGCYGPEFVDCDDPRLNPASDEPPKAEAKSCFRQFLEGLFA